MNKLCMWIVCLGSLACLGLLIWIKIKQDKCCKNESYVMYPSMSQSKKMLGSNICQSAACNAWNGGATQCGMCNIAAQSEDCCNCN